MSLPPKVSVDQDTTRFSPPEMLSERCVHSMIGNAGCRACIDVCPQDAWVLDDEALGLAVDLCDGCGLCAPACPQQAISIGQFPLLKLWNKSEAVFVACEFSGALVKPGIVPCVHSIGYREILELYRMGIRTFAVSTGSCWECVRGNGVPLSQRIETLNRVFATSENPPISARSLAPNEWGGLTRELADLAFGPRLSRRGFFRSFITADVSSDLNLGELLGRHNPGFRHLEELLPDHSESALWPSVPSIDGAVCSGCDTCVKLCPHSAILLAKLEDQICYRLEPGLCSGCGICTDVCEHGAISLESWTMQRQLVVPLVELLCTVCGVSFHEPQERADSLKSRCSVCSKKNGQKLFQVID